MQSLEKFIPSSPPVCSCPNPPYPRQTTTGVSRAPGYIYFPSNACPTQTETRKGYEHSLAHFPACHQQNQTFQDTREPTQGHKEEG